MFQSVNQIQNDLLGIHDGPVLRDKVVRKVQNAFEKRFFFFFQVINHGISTHVLDEMIKGTCRFHQQDVRVRKEYYICDPNKKVVYISNYSLAAKWRESLGFPFLISKSLISFFSLSLCQFDRRIFRKKNINLH
ncbi:putative non-heme dioxygenase domain, isopenicillin N synthase [Medicago truncatula]|nr:putative non-heme dioxygenase domain, isopenicillin N synthase [Medicago truncatula]